MAPSLDRREAGEGPIVSGFSADGFVIDGSAFGAVLLTPEQAIHWRPPAEVDIAALEPLVSLRPVPEFILLGTGRTLRFPSRTLVAALEAQGIGIETMDSRAAARAWALLRSEHRWIAAALLPL